jgi:hypothetical protein
MPPTRLPGSGLPAIPAMPTVEKMETAAMRQPNDPHPDVRDTTKQAHESSPSLTPPVPRTSRLAAPDRMPRALRPPLAESPRTPLVARARKIAWTPPRVPLSPSQDRPTRLVAPADAEEPPVQMPQLRLPTPSHPGSSPPGQPILRGQHWRPSPASSAQRRESLISIGRVEVQVNNHPPRPAPPPRAKPGSATPLILESRFLGRFLLRP